MPKGSQQVMIFPVSVHQQSVTKIYMVAHKINWYVIMWKGGIPLIASVTLSPSLYHHRHLHFHHRHHHKLFSPSSFSCSIIMLFWFRLNHNLCRLYRCWQYVCNNTCACDGQCVQMMPLGFKIWTYLKILVCLFATLSERCLLVLVRGHCSNHFVIILCTERKQGKCHICG